MIRYDPNLKNATYIFIYPGTQLSCPRSVDISLMFPPASSLSDKLSVCVCLVEYSKNRYTNVSFKHTSKMITLFIRVY